MEWLIAKYTKTAAEHRPPLRTKKVTACRCDAAKGGARRGPGRDSAVSRSSPASSTAGAHRRAARDLAARRGTAAFEGRATAEDPDVQRRGCWRASSISGRARVIAARPGRAPPRQRDGRQSIRWRYDDWAFSVRLSGACGCFLRHRRDDAAVEGQRRPGRPHHSPQDWSRSDVCATAAADLTAAHRYRRRRTAPRRQNPPRCVMQAFIYEKYGH